jgi:hypothetical protein
MPGYRFERECRTAHSEAYVVSADDNRVGRVDLHFTPSIVYATLCVGSNTTTDEIQDLIDIIDEELVMSADVPRDDFIVTVYQGREAGVFSDEEFGEDEDDQ